MFPFQQGDLVSFQVINDEDEDPTNYSTTQTYLNHQKVEQDLGVSSFAHVHSPPPLQYYDHGQLDQTNVVMGNYPANPTRKGTLRSSLSISEEVSNAPKEDEMSTQDVVAKKRAMHREIERQRRQEMANLYSSLRSILPIEYIKGKRAISDHISAAAKYIKDSEKNVKELEDKRDKLKESSSSLEIQLPGDHSNVGCQSSSCNYSSTRPDCNVSFHSLSSTIEIEISSPIGGDEDAFPLSRVLSVLVEEGLSIINCVSSKVNQRWIYVIHCEINDGTSVDSNQLQCRLKAKLVHIYESIIR